MKNDRGFIKWIIIIAIALIILGYYGFSLRQAVESPTTQDNLSYFKDTLFWIWEHILKIPAMFLWDNVAMPLIHRLSHS